MTKPGFSRRTLFKSASLAIPAVALPVLRSSPLLGATPGTRLVVFYSSNGTIPDAWKPKGTVDNWEFPAEGILEPLVKFKSKLNLLWGVHYKSGEKGPGSGHQKGPVSALTGLRAIQKDPGYATGISVDQWMANKWGTATRFKTVEFAAKNRTSGNRACISYLGANQPVFPENDPVKAYARYFGNFTPPPVTGGPAATPDVGAERLLLRRKSALDFVQADLGRLSRRLPGDERVRLDRHLESLRDLERQLSPMASSGGAECKPASPKGGSDYQAHSRLQIDNMFMALACGQSRLAHMIWAGETSQQAHPWLGFNDLHHDLSHRDNEAVAKGKLVKINRWYAEEFGHFIGRLDSVVEGNGKTMLDNSLVIWLNGMGEGKNHTRNNIPFVLAGLGGGAVKGGRYMTYNNPHNQLLVSILHMMGFRDQNTFGDPEYTGPLPGLVT